MTRTTIDEAALRTWAGHLLDHSLAGINPGERVMLKGEPITYPLLQILSEGVVRAGGLPDLYLVSPDNNRGGAWGADMARHGTAEQIEQVPDWLVERYDAMDKYIEILGTAQPDLLRDLPVDGAQAVARATMPLVETRLAKPWVITLFPTPADAANEGLALEEYTDLIVGASTTDHGTMGQLLEGVQAAMARASTVRIVTEHPDGRRLELSLGIGGQRIVVCDGRRNFPDGEVFTSPDARTVTGEIFVDLPIVSAGKKIRGIYLKIEDGRIVDHDALEGAGQLRTIIETDEGSHRLGEVAFGMNTGLDRVLTHPLYVEKVAGTLHIAIGSSYKECFGEAGGEELARAEADGACNSSAVHVDIVADARPGGCVREVWLDDTRLAPDDDLLWRLT